MSAGLGLTWVVLALLVAASATLSSSETALFSLTPPERARAGPLVRRLLAQPRPLLSTILLGNLVVNLLFFAFSLRLSRGGGRLAEVASGFGALMTILVLGEILPKTLGLRARETVARVTAVPVAALLPLTGPVARLLDAFLELFYRALGAAGREEGGITPELLGRVLERSAERGELLTSEAQFLSGIAELEDLRVRELMTPRVDMLFLERAEEDRAELVQRALAARAPWIVVVDDDPDHVVGLVRLRDLLTRAERPVDELVVPVRFVPEVASGSALLHFLREAGVAQAVVVDEWGGTAGWVTLEDVFEHVVGELREEGERVESPVVDLGEGRFRVDGSLSIRDWNELFGHRVVPIEFETVAGWVTALLGRIPHPGDRVEAAGLRFEVRRVAGRRITRVDLEAIEEAREDGPEGRASPAPGPIEGAP